VHAHQQFNSRSPLTRIPSAAVASQEELRALAGPDDAAMSCDLDTVAMCLDAGQEGLLTEQQFGDLVREACGGCLAACQQDAAVALMLVHCEALVQAATLLRVNLQGSFSGITPQDVGASVASAPPAVPSSPKATPRKRAFGRPAAAAVAPKTPFPAAMVEPATPMRTPARASIRSAMTPFRTPFKTPRIRQQQQYPGIQQHQQKQPQSAAALPRLRRKPTVLIIGKGVQNIPFESMPCLRHLPVTRMPCLPFIVHRTATTPMGVEVRPIVQVKVASRLRSWEIALSNPYSKCN